MKNKHTQEDVGCVQLTLERGHYKLRENWTPDRPDRRKTGRGLDTVEGMPKGTRFSVRGSGNDLELTAPFVLGSRAIAVATDNGRWWYVTPSIERLIRELEPDTSTETWLDHQIGASAYMHGCGDDVLLILLEKGVVSREQITAAVAEYEARLDAAEAAEREREAGQ